MDQKIAGSIIGQGTDLGCGFDPLLGHVWEATDRCFSFSPSLPLTHPALPLLLKAMKKKMSLGED